MESQNVDQLLYKLRNITVNKRQGRRSPHKPLLILLSIGRQLSGQENPATWQETEPKLKTLIRDYGLPDSRENAHLPFWRLKNDGIWQIDRPEQVRETSRGDPYTSDLRRHEIKGSLTPEFKRAIETDPEFLQLTLHLLLNTYFPPSLHDDILIDTGIEPFSTTVQPGRTTAYPAMRDGDFRGAVLEAYGNRCAICQLDLRVRERAIGVEAAHIRWHSEGGPAQVTNGMAMCLLHHKLFDYGLFTVSRDLTVHASSIAIGESADALIANYHGSTLRIIPDSLELQPAPVFLDWHRKAVFKGKAAA